LRRELYLGSLDCAVNLDTSRYNSWSASSGCLPESTIRRVARAVAVGITGVRKGLLGCLLLLQIEQHRLERLRHAQRAFPLQPVELRASHGHRVKLIRMQDDLQNRAPMALRYGARVAMLVRRVLAAEPNA